MFALRPVFGPFLDKIGVGREEVRRGRNAGILQSPSGWSGEQRELLKRGIDRTYDTFIDKVADGRGLSREEVERVAGGRVWSGDDALEHGLIDRVSSVSHGSAYSGGITSRDRRSSGLCVARIVWEAT